VLCLWPGKELPKSDIPFIDKWTHFILFGVFSFLWLCAYPGRGLKTILYIILISAALGWLVECMQGWFPDLGRSKDNMDAVADAIGGILGALLYRSGQYISRNKHTGSLH
jgi:VanZ family protein